VDCYVSFNDIKWLLIKVTGLDFHETYWCTIFVLSFNGTFIEFWVQRFVIREIVRLCLIACDFYSVNFLVVIVDANVLYLIKYFTFVRSNLDLLSLEIVIEDSEVFYLFLLAKEVK
jgi:hypothetical protein